MAFVGVAHYEAALIQQHRNSLLAQRDPRLALKSSDLARCFRRLDWNFLIHCDQVQIRSAKTALARMTVLVKHHLTIGIHVVTLFRVVDVDK